jgi:outer membrane protein TolC
MKRRLIITLLSLAAGHPAFAQSRLEDVLASVVKHNKTLAAHNQYWEAQKLGFRAGLSPANPVVGFDYMVGSPAAAGNQTDFTLTQSLDFPTAYVKRQQLADKQAQQVEWQMLGTRQDLLLQAKLVCLDLVYHHRLQAQLERRMARTAQLRQDFQTKLDQGDANILDLNKAQLMLLSISQQSQENQTMIARLEAQLAALNGGIPIVFVDTAYPELPKFASFDSLEQEVEAADPMRHRLEQAMDISEAELAVSKALKLPKVEIGYHYQGILGQAYNGVHTGLTLPLWEQRHTTQAREAEMAWAGLELEDHVNAHLFEVKELFQQYQGLVMSQQAYRTLLGSLNTEALLSKGLALGQISVIEYFLELAYYYQADDHLLRLERDLHQIGARLTKHRL